MCDAHPIFNGWGSHGQCVRTRILFLVLSGSGDSIIAFCLLYLTPVGDKFCRDERCHVSFSSLLPSDACTIVVERFTFRRDNIISAYL
jgi:hypothetical protein